MTDNVFFFQEYDVASEDEDDGRLTIDEGSSESAESAAAAMQAAAAAAAAAQQARLAELQIPEKQIKALTAQHAAQQAAQQANKPAMSFLGLEPLPQR